MTKFIKGKPVTKIGKEIDTFCERQGISQTAFARAVGVNEAMISYIRMGKRTVSRRMIERIREIPGTEAIVSAGLRSIGIHPVADRLNRVIKTYPDAAKDVSDFLDILGAPE